MKRIIAFISVFALILSLASCSEKKSVALTSGSTEISGEIFHSELLSYKNDFLVSYLGVTEDSEELWAQDSPAGRGETLGETIVRLALEDMVQFTWVVEYARANGMTVTDEDLKNIETDKKALRDSFESEEGYQKYLSLLKLDDGGMQEYMELTVLYDKGFNLLTAPNGPYPILDGDYDAYYEENYYTVKHIFINNVSRTDSEGNEILLDEAEKKEKEEKAVKILNDLEGGASFDNLYMLSEDSMSTNYPDGITFTTGMMDTAYENAVKSIGVGEYTMFEGEGGGIIIVYRLPLSEKGREEYDTLVKSAVCNGVIDKIYMEHNDEVEIDYDVVNSYKLIDVPILFENVEE